METMNELARQDDGRTVMISCEIDLGLDWLLEAIWQVRRLSFPFLRRFTDHQQLGLVKSVRVFSRMSAS